MRFKDKFRDIVKAKKSFKMSEIAEDFETSGLPTVQQTLIVDKGVNPGIKSVRQALKRA